MKFCDKSSRIKFFNSNTSEGTDCKLLFGKLKDFNDVFNEFNADGSMDSKWLDDMTSALKFNPDSLQEDCLRRCKLVSVMSGIQKEEKFC